MKNNSQLICPNCGYDLYRKIIINYQKEITNMFGALEKNTRRKIKDVLFKIDKFSTIRQYDIWKDEVVAAIREMHLTTSKEVTEDIKPPIIDKALEEYIQGNHEMKGVNYLKSMILNLEANKNQISLFQGSKPPIKIIV